MGDNFVKEHITLKVLALNCWRSSRVVCNVKWTKFEWHTWHSEAWEDIYADFSMGHPATATTHTCENNEQVQNLVHTYREMVIRLTAPRQFTGSQCSISEAISDAKTSHSDDTSLLASQFGCMWLSSIPNHKNFAEKNPRCITGGDTEAYIIHIKNSIIRCVPEMLPNEADEKLCITVKRNSSELDNSN
jgi:hypothetical protein